MTNWSWCSAAIQTGLVVAALMIGVCSFGQGTSPAPPPLLLGAAWYPEQWPESRWDEDLALMQQAGIHMVRVGEFAWSRMEPEEGRYDLDWLDRAIAAAAKHNIYTVVGTPTAAPPAWLTQKYPETLRVFEDGRRAEHGNRQQFDWANPKYRRTRTRKSRNNWPNDVGTIHMCWAGRSTMSTRRFPSIQKPRAQFQEWLKARYGTLDNLTRGGRRHIGAKPTPRGIRSRFRSDMATPGCC